MSGEIEGMDGCRNYNTSSRDFLGSGCCTFFSWGNLEQLNRLFLFFVHYCFTFNCFSSRIIRGGSLPVVSAIFEMWSCIQKEMPGMLLDWLHAECISQVCGVNGGLWKEEPLLFTVSAYYLNCQQAVSGQSEIKAAGEQNGIFVNCWLWKGSFDLLNWWEVTEKGGS